ncbi:hypothetical protein DXG03_006520 [Asterophora parasitica]|uniref:Uncharacterized protein n=1 Tax=Asterophora parasitica TaxID=117018 RepID=A0A9P7KAK5_9AGAR|nr:hypothetical protein DXG03_006520 [Asterophora parasitica]
MHPSVMPTKITVPFSSAKLHRDTHNWKNWDCSFLAFITMNQLASYIIPPYTYMPSPTSEPQAFSYYMDNLNMCIAALSCIDKTLYDLIDYKKGICESYKNLKEHCQGVGPID